jgi:hypothetical protein
MLLLTSTAGDQQSSLLKRWRERGLAAIEAGIPSSFYMAEWSIPPGHDPMDPTVWRYSNPALGRTIDVATLQAESEGPNRASSCEPR